MIATTQHHQPAAHPAWRSVVIRVKGSPASPDQRRNIRIVLDTIHRETRRESPVERWRYATAAIMTITQESEARTVPTADSYGSVGLFQQQASWGSYAHRMSPEWSAVAWLDSFRRVHHKFEGKGHSLGWQVDESQRSYTYGTPRQGHDYDAWHAEAARTVAAWNRCFA